MSESPVELLREMRDRMGELPVRLAEALARERRGVVRGYLPGERLPTHHEQEQEGEEPQEAGAESEQERSYGPYRRRQYQQRSRRQGYQGAFAQKIGVDQEVLDSGKSLGFRVGGMAGKLAAKLEEIESLYNAVHRFMEVIKPKQAGPSPASSHLLPGPRGRPAPPVTPFAAKPTTPPALPAPAGAPTAPQPTLVPRSAVPPGAKPVVPTTPKPRPAPAAPAAVPAPSPPPAPAPKPLPAPAPRAPVPAPKVPTAVPVATPVAEIAPKAPPPSTSKSGSLPPFLKPEHLGLPPDWAAKKAKDAAIAAGKTAREVEEIGQKAVEYAHEHTTNRMAVYQRELMRAQLAGKGDEEARKAASDAVEAMSRKRQEPAAPKPRPTQKTEQQAQPNPPVTTTPAAPKPRPTSSRLADKKFLSPPGRLKTEAELATKNRKGANLAEFARRSNRSLAGMRRWLWSNPKPSGASPQARAMTPKAPKKEIRPGQGGVAPEAPPAKAVEGRSSSSGASKIPEEVDSEGGRLEAAMRGLTGALEENTQERRREQHHAGRGSSTGTQHTSQPGHASHPPLAGEAPAPLSEERGNIESTSKISKDMVFRTLMEIGAF